MKCIVFGGGGFIGSHLSEALIDAGHDVTIFDKTDARNLDFLHQKGAKLFVGDFFNADDLSSSLQNNDIVFHLVSVTVPQTSNEDPLFDVEANIIGTLRMLEAAKEAGVKKIIFASSGGTVYGIPYDLPITENHLTNPITSYGITKLTIEKYLQLYWHLYGLDYCILRIANAYGERQSITETQGVIPAFLDKIIHQSEIIVWGDGNVVRDYIYISDIVRAFLFAISYKGKSKIFNIGTEQGYSLNDVIRLIKDVTKRSLPVRYKPGRPFDVSINILDISHAKTALNWYPKINLTEGIAKVYEWLLKVNEK